jgi:hypothetical protein
MSVSNEAANTYLEHHANYWEEVRKLVDGVLSEIRTGTVKSQGQAIYQLLSCVEQSIYVDAQQMLCVHTLQCSENANAWFAQFVRGPSGFRKFMLERMAGFGTLKGNCNVLLGDFPFGEMAEAAMKSDAMALLMQQSCVTELPANLDGVDSVTELFNSVFSKKCATTYRSSCEQPNRTNTGKN